MTEYVLKLTRSYFSSYGGLSELVWSGIFLCFIEATFSGVYFFLPAYFVSTLNLDITVAATIISFYGLGTILGGYLAGRLADLYGSSIICIFSLILQAIVFFLLSRLTSNYKLACALFAMGICSNAFLTCNYLWVLGHCANEKERLTSLSILNVGTNLGLSVSAIFIGFIGCYNFYWVFLLGSMFLLLLALYLAYVVVNDSTIIEQNDLKNGAASNNLNQLVCLVLFCVFLVGFIIFQTNTTYSFYLQTTFPSLGLRALSILFSLNCLMVVFLQTPIVNIFKDFNKIIVMGAGAFLIGTGMLILNFAYNFGIAIISCVLYTIGELMFFSIAQLICYQSSGGNKKGRAMGMYRTIYASSRVIGPILGSVIFARVGAGVLWYFCGVLGLVCLLISLGYNLFIFSNRVLKF